MKRRPAFSPEELREDLTLFGAVLAGAPTPIEEVLEDDVDGDEMSDDVDQTPAELEVEAAVEDAPSGATFVTARFEAACVGCGDPTTSVRTSDAKFVHPHCADGLAPEKPRRRFKHLAPRRDAAVLVQRSPELDGDAVRRALEIPSLVGKRDQKKALASVEGVKTEPPRLECWVTNGRTVCLRCAVVFTGAVPTALLPPRVCAHCNVTISDLWPTPDPVYDDTKGQCAPCVAAGNTDYDEHLAHVEAERLPADTVRVAGATCGSCGGATVLRRLNVSKLRPDEFPYGCENCGNLREEDVEQPSLLEKLVAAKPKEVRRAGLGLVATLVDAIEKGYSPVPDLRFALEHGVDGSEKFGDEIGRWVEKRGMLEGLAIRLPTLKGARFASVLQDCLTLSDELLAETARVVLPTSVAISRGKGWPIKELARRVRAELAPRAETVEIKEAFLDESQAYRFRLSRMWDPEKPPILLIGLNPSTADAEKDDQTIRRGRTLGKREGRGSLVMLNLFAWRSTDPKALETVPDPVGSPVNDEVILEALKRGGPKLVVCAWGSLANEKQRTRAKEVVELIRAAGIDPMCFGKTKDGSPRHPSRLPNDVALEEYRGRELGVRWFRCDSCQDVGCEKCL